MSWSISKLENSVTVPKEAVAPLGRKLASMLPDTFELDPDYIDGMTDKDVIASVFGSSKEGTPYFEPDHMEHMDWLTNDAAVCAAFAEAGATGKVCFGSLEGDNSNNFWGVEFASGQFRRLVGKIDWIAGTSNPGTISHA